MVKPMEGTNLIRTYMYDLGVEESNWPEQWESEGGEGAGEGRTRLEVIYTHIVFLSMYS